MEVLLASQELDKSRDLFTSSTGRFVTEDDSVPIAARRCAIALEKQMLIGTLSEYSTIVVDVNFSIVFLKQRPLPVNPSLD